MGRMKALIIDAPWIELILRGEKTSQMRRPACHQKGHIALIRKGSGSVVGVADCAGLLPALADATAYRAAEPKHRFPVDRQAQAFADGWRMSWVITNARPLDRPVAHAHQPGALNRDSFHKRSSHLFFRDRASIRDFFRPIGRAGRRHAYYPA